MPIIEEDEREEKSKESSRGTSGRYGKTTKGTARIEEEFNRRVKEEGRKALWKRHPRRGMTIRIGLVYKGNDSGICKV